MITFCITSLNADYDITIVVSIFENSYQINNYTADKIEIPKMV